MPSVTFQPIADDLVAANRAYFRSSLRTRRMLKSYLLGGLVFGVIAVGLDWQEPVKAKVTTLVDGVLFWTLLLSLILAFNYALLPRRVRRIFVQQKALHDEVAIHWTDESISFESGRGSSRFVWSDFIRIADNKAAIVMLQSDALFNFIPKRALSADQVASIMGHRG